MFGYWLVENNCSSNISYYFYNSYYTSSTNEVHEKKKVKQMRLYVEEGQLKIVNFIFILFFFFFHVQYVRISRLFLSCASIWSIDIRS